MTPERWQQINSLFFAALEQATEQRLPFVAEACKGDDSLRAEVESLLASHNKPTGFVDTAPVTAMFDLLDHDTSSFGEAHIGPYRLVKQLGEGGMGAVYLAVRDDDEYEQKVAIKLIRQPLPSRLTLERFRAERQILAGFDHPSIARLLDGGTTLRGLPYLVMEYIEGEPVDTHCDTHHLSISERLRLFREVCAAVHYAHQRLVIHRDIKPSNILVTHNGTPKLLDFGIAKLLDPLTRDYETETATLVRAMTPEYASPEQVRGEHITTSSDVYSLGVVLYELLTGHPPYRFASRAPLEVAHVISLSEPERPSTVIYRSRTRPNADAVTEPVTPEQISALREGSPDKLRRRLEGDLDNIVLMAMRKEPGRRYASAEQLSEDLRRHLEGRPVIARKDTPGYRVSKFVRRNRIAVAAAMLVFMIVITGGVVTLWQAHIARTQRHIASDERDRAQRRFGQVRQIAHSVLFNYYDAVNNLPGSTQVREQIISDMLNYLNNLASEAVGDTSLQLELADAYDRVSSVQGGVTHTNVGDTSAAIASRRKAIEIREAVLTADPGNQQARLRQSASFRNLGELLSEADDPEGALVACRQSVATAEALVVDEATSPVTRRALGDSYSTLGSFLMGRGEWQEALANERKAVSVDEKLLGEAPNDDTLRRSLSVEYEAIAQIQLQTSDPSGALETQHKAVEMREALMGSHPENVDYRGLLSAGYYYLGTVEWHFAKVMGRREYLQPALDGFRKAAAIAEKLAAADPKDVTSRTGNAQLAVGFVLDEMGRLVEAGEAFRKTLASREEVAAADPTNQWKRWLVIEAGAKTARCLAKLKEVAAASDQCRKTLRLIDQSAGESLDGDLLNAKADAFQDLADAYAEMGVGPLGSSGQPRAHWQAARRLYQQSLEILLDMKKRGTLSSTEDNTIAAVQHGIACCNTALER